MNTYEFAGSSAVVLGGTGALGRSIIQILAQNGQDIALSYARSQDKAENLLDELSTMGRRGISMQADLDNHESITAFVDKAADTLPDLGIAIYAAGLDIGQPFVSQIDMPEWQRVIHSDVDGFFAFAKAVVPKFKERGGGTIVAVTTTAVGRYAIRDALSAVPKAAVEMTAKAIAKEEGRFGIRVNCVAPGMLNVGLGQRMLEQDYAGPASETIRKGLPLQAFGNEKDIAHAVAFLASSVSRYTTGQTLAVDGGWQI